METVAREPEPSTPRFNYMRELVSWIAPLVLVAGCSRPAVGGGAAIQVTFDSTAHAEAGRADLAAACHLARITYDDHYGLRAAQQYEAPTGGPAAIETATACAKRFPHGQAVSVLP